LYDGSSSIFPNGLFLARRILKNETMLNQYGIPKSPKTIQLRKPYREEGASGPPARFLDFGHLRPVFQKGLLNQYLDWALEQKDDFVVWLGTKPHVVLARPESVLRVLGKDNTFLRNTQPSEYLFGKGLLRLEGEQWKYQRSLLASAFRGHIMDNAVSIIQREFDQLIDKWGKEKTIRPNRELSFLIMNVLGKSFLVLISTRNVTEGQNCIGPSSPWPLPQRSFTCFPCLW
jgi:hypothetical protein